MTLFTFLDMKIYIFISDVLSKISSLGKISRLFSNIPAISEIVGATSQNIDVSSQIVGVVSQNVGATSQNIHKLNNLLRLVPTLSYNDLGRIHIIT